MKYFYYAVQCQTKDGKFYATTEKVSQSNNLLNVFGKEVIIVVPCSSHKEAAVMVDDWNRCFKQQGKFVG